MRPTVWPTSPCPNFSCIFPHFVLVPVCLPMNIFELQIPLLDHIIPVFHISVQTWSEDTYCIEEISSRATPNSSLRWSYNQYKNSVGNMYACRFVPCTKCQIEIHGNLASYQNGENLIPVFEPWTSCLPPATTCGLANSRKRTRYYYYSPILSCLWLITNFVRRSHS